MISSHKDNFFKAHKEGKNFIPIAQTWPADLETPLSTWLKLSEKDSHGVFLESVEGGENLGRWSVVATKPLWEAVCCGEEIVKTWNNGKTETHKGDPFDILKVGQRNISQQCLKNYHQLDSYMALGVMN